MLYSLVLKLKNNLEGVNSYQIYSSFLKEVDLYFNERSEKYHQKNQKKPFTISPIYTIDGQSFLRFTFLTDEIFNIGFYIFSNINYFKIKDQKLLIESILIKKSKSYPHLVNKMIDNLDPDKKELVKNKKIIINFQTPTLFRKADEYINYFDKEAFDGSFKNKQKEIFDKEIFSLPKYKVLNIKTTTKNYDLPPFNKYYGFVGKVAIFLEDGNLNYFRAISFFGAGIKTTMGMGQVLVGF